MNANGGKLKFRRIVGAALHLAFLWLGVLFLASPLVETWNALRSHAWPATTGQLHSVNIVTQRSFHATRWPYSHKVLVDYSYTVNGRTFRSGQLKFLNYEYFGLTRTSRAANREADLFRGANVVQVHYCPAVPELSVLRTGIGLRDGLCLLGQLVLFGGAAFFILMSLINFLRRPLLMKDFVRDLVYPYVTWRRLAGSFRRSTLKRWLRPKFLAGVSALLARLALCAVLLGLTGLAMFLASREIHSGWQSHFWPTAAGTILAAEPDWNSDRTAYYSLNLTYRYAVGGTNYLGSRVAFCSLGSLITEKSRQTEFFYSPGKTLPVYYRPRAPWDSVLEPGIGLVYLLTYAAVATLGFIFAFAVLDLGSMPATKNYHEIDSGMFTTDR
jgi:hypothetical protein